MGEKKEKWKQEMENNPYCAHRAWNYSLVNKQKQNIIIAGLGRNGQRYSNPSFQDPGEHG